MAGLRVCDLTARVRAGGCCVRVGDGVSGWRTASALMAAFRDNAGFVTAGLLPQQLLGGLALAGFALACGLTLCDNLASDRVDDIVTPPKVTIVTAQPAAPVTVAARRAALASLPGRIAARHRVPDGTLLDRATPRDDARDVLVRPAGDSSPSHACRSRTSSGRPRPRRSLRSVPLPTPRPTDLGRHDRQHPDQASREKIATAAVSVDPFEKLFGKRESGPELAYAPADGGVTSSGASKPAGRLPLNDGYSAIYDITGAHRAPARRHQARGALRARPEDGRSAPRERAHARRDAAARLRSRAARGAVPWRRGAAPTPRRRRGGDPRPHRPADAYLSARPERRFRTAAFRSRTTTRSCAPTKTAR